MTTVQPIAFILVGKPGGGKGTVLQLLKDLIERGQKSVFTSDTGEMFREMKKGSPSSLIKANDRMKERIAEINDAGLLQVSALAGALWTALFVDQYQWKEPYIIMDGSPRRGVELLMLEEFLDEFIQAKTQFIHIETDDEVVIQRMLERHKNILDPKQVHKRL